MSPVNFRQVPRGRVQQRHIDPIYFDIYDDDDEANLDRAGATMLLFPHF